MSLPKATVRRIMERAGADRVQDEAVGFLIEYIERILHDVTFRALKYMEHGGRKTLYKDDIEWALSVRNAR